VAGYYGHCPSGKSKTIGFIPFTLSIAKRC